jgi:hypothetical protein
MTITTTQGGNVRLHEIGREIKARIDKLIISAAKLSIWSIQSRH